MKNEIPLVQWEDNHASDRQAEWERQVRAAGGELVNEARNEIE